MSAAAVDILAFAGRRSRWAEDSDGFHIGERHGRFIGCIDRTVDGSFVAFDGRATPVGRYRSLRDAKRAVDDIASGVTWARPSRMTRTAQSVASVTGVIAAATLAAAGAQAVVPLI
jgi:hypothetical protein